MVHCTRSPLTRTSSEGPTHTLPDRKQTFESMTRPVILEPNGMGKPRATHDFVKTNMKELFTFRQLNLI